ncbi:sodium/potassium-transporting ATPase subunit beta-2-like [Plodia interpunctella]|uniref:sodium/potassium-transporting ATPase subunit beta-2-like n=1 Tax=Plodia interpunctella TaxID=58824 RepID=UPI002368CD47|nr:sodium/potassium-transporting ATPase subunit beta-2-like [Plodia interpunctella]
MNNSHVSEDWARAPPPSGPVWETIAKVLYNPEDSSILGRTPKRWGIVLTFYLVFYAVLAAMFAACMGGLYYTLDPTKPSFTLHQSLIGINPGMSFRPSPLADVEIRPGAGNSTAIYINELQQYLSKPLASWIPLDTKKCITEDNFGFPRSPCIFVKLNKIFDWVPEYYDASQLPEDMPDDLRKHIKGLDPLEPASVWVSCADEAQADGTLPGTVFEYPWGRGLLGIFPYRKQENDFGAFLPVAITPPVNKEVYIRCRAWAKNIIYKKSLKEPSGYTRFRLFVKADETTESTTVASE